MTERDDVLAALRALYDETNRRLPVSSRALAMARAVLAPAGTPQEFRDPEHPTYHKCYANGRTTLVAGEVASCRRCGGAGAAGEAGAPEPSLWDDESRKIADVVAIALLEAGANPGRLNKLGFHATIWGAIATKRHDGGPSPLLALACCLVNMEDGKPQEERHLKELPKYWRRLVELVATKVRAGASGGQEMAAFDRAEFDELLREVVALREWKAAHEAAAFGQAPAPRSVAPPTDDELVALGECAIDGHLDFVSARGWFANWLAGRAFPPERP